MQMGGGLKITYDPEASAVYVLVSTPTGETIVDDEGMIIDLDADGNPRGYEFLMVRERGVPVKGLPPSITHAVTDFTACGTMNSKVYIEQDY
jgi:uncharacterized protein YuzE